MNKSIEKFAPTSWCEGIAGDGCGGGRIFFTDKNSVKVFDPVSKEVMTLVTDLEEPLGISKKECRLFFTCKGKLNVFDLSAMQLVSDF
jgi:hypothetical protein